MSDEELYSLSIGIEGVCRILNIDPVNLLRKAGLSEDFEPDADIRVTAEEFFAAWTAATVLTKEPEYLLHLGISMARGPIVPVFFALTCAPDLETGANRMAMYKTLLGPATLQCYWLDQQFHIEIGSAHPSHALPGSLAALHLVVLLENIRKSSARYIKPIATSLVAEQPERNQLEQFFGVGLEYGPTNRISFSYDDAKRSFVSANPEFWRSLEEDLKMQFLAQKGVLPMKERVRSILLGLMATGRANAENVATNLGLSRSTLQRRLREEDTTLRQILEQTRHEIAKRYLANTELQIQEIGAVLGYRDANSFTRGFRRWTGVSPENYRDSELQSDGQRSGRD